MPSELNTADDQPAQAQAEEGASKSGIKWIENDYPLALKLAKEQDKALVIDMWAAWCHTCVAMQSGTLRDAGLADDADRFIWLAIDTETSTSAEVMAKFPPKVWPTFFVVSPVDESVQATQLGSCSVTAFRDFLVRGQHGHLAQMGDHLAPDSPLFQLRAGDQLWTESKFAEAATAYGKALASGGPAWPHAAATLNRQISALARLDDQGACARLAVREVERMSREHNASGSDFMDYAGACSEALASAGNAKAAKDLRLKVLTGLDAIYSDAEAALSMDDRSGILASSRSIAEALGQAPMVMAYARAQQKLLDAAVKAAQSPMEEMTYIWHQVELHSFLGEGERILPWVESLEARLPNEYDPPYRKAWLLFHMERYPEAHAALVPALERAQAGRKGRMLALDAEIYHAEGNREKERELRQATLAYYEGLADGLASEGNSADAKAALEAMDAP